MFGEKDAVAVLRLLCLLSAVQGGLPRKHADSLRRAVLHAHGHPLLLVLSRLSRTGTALRPRPLYKLARPCSEGLNPLEDSRSPRSSLTIQRAALCIDVVLQGSCSFKGPHPVCSFALAAQYLEHSITASPTRQLLTLLHRPPSRKLASERLQLPLP